MKVPQGHLNALIESRALKQEEDDILADYETNQRRMRKRSEMKQKHDSLLQTERADDIDSVLLPGHILPAKTIPPEIHTVLQSSVTFRDNQTFFDSKRGTDRNGAASPQQPASRQELPNHSTVLASEGDNVDPELIQSSESSASEAPASERHAPTKGGLLRTKGCRAKVMQDRANGRASESNQTHTIVSANMTDPNSPKRSEGSSSSVLANSHHLPVSVPNLTPEGHGGLSQGALAGIAIAIIFLASIPITIAIFRYRRRKRNQKLCAMFDTDMKENYAVPVAPDHRQQDYYQHISHTEIDELMNRVASVQLPKPSHQSRNI
ncbi:hypothetical protein PCANC_06027 [Puccinia coronata f. sp. avenae]|uniref:Uncharacterized protein n=1 Tax=Puccinia coronata f. sp. avenae TaxID=200324 RepID=A0A2N5VB32_9BASI|nr:hypothetical protein PCANC_06027 [Puccinia coronata f. sp. avenae]PLW47200.1 hypothetical protein PCASD_02369 [Puccinia coronata f. sp. avenae]